MSFTGELQVLDNIVVGERIRKARKAAGMNALELAESIGIGKDMMSKIENGRATCVTENIFKISQVLNISTDDLYYGKKDTGRAEQLEELVHGLSEKQFEVLMGMMQVYVEGVSAA